MRRFFFLLLFSCLALPLPAASPLSDHPSPYLAMHADDPVAWRLWDEALLEQARRENKLIYISSGYFACHWCHVMQRESFQNAAIARQLNTYFIPVKIDRELWPELDRYLIDFVERLSGRAGWPLNVFITPQGDPLVGTTYLPPERFLVYLQRLQRRWEERQKALTLLAQQAEREEQLTDPESVIGPAELSRRMEENLLEAWGEEADMLEGGFGEQAKFPKVPQLEALLSISAAHPELTEFLQLTLGQMARQGLRDHLAGGFFRYTVDPGWQQPHFEKLLIDNAQLARLYLLAAVRWEERYFHRIGLETLDFILREMHHDKGAYISALSAVDGDGVDGGYYLWTEQELGQVLGRENTAVAQRLWGMEGAAYWEAGLLPIAQSEPSIAAEKREQLRQRLLQQRASRILPRDEKRLAAENGLLLSVLSLVANEKPRYREAGEAVRDYLHSLWDGERLWRMRDSQGETFRQAGLADYAAVARGLLDWAETSGDGASRRLANTLAENAWRRFYRDNGWRLAPLSRTQPLVADAVSPSPVVMLLQVDKRLGGDGPLTGQQWHRALLAAPQRLQQQPLEYASYLTPLQWLAAGDE